MTYDEKLKMDCLIAKNFFGWEECEISIAPHSGLPLAYGYSPADHPSPITGYRAKSPVRKYSTDMNDAWDLLDKVGVAEGLGSITIHHRGNLQGFEVLSKDGRKLYGEGNTAELAICDLALKAKGIEFGRGL